MAYRYYLSTSPQANVDTFASGVSIGCSASTLQIARPTGFNVRTSNAWPKYVFRISESRPTSESIPIVEVSTRALWEQHVGPMRTFDDSLEEIILSGDLTRLFGRDAPLADHEV